MADTGRTPGVEALEPQSLEGVLDGILRSLEETEQQLRVLGDGLKELVESLESQAEVLDELRDVYQDLAYRGRVE